MGVLTVQQLSWLWENLGPFPLSWRVLLPLRRVWEADSLFVAKPQVHDGLQTQQLSALRELLASIHSPGVKGKALRFLWHHDCCSTIGASTPGPVPANIWSQT